MCARIKSFARFPFRLSLGERLMQVTSCFFISETTVSRRKTFSSENVKISQSWQQFVISASQTLFPFLSWEGSGGRAKKFRENFSSLSGGWLVCSQNKNVSIVWPPLGSCRSRESQSRCFASESGELPSMSSVKRCKLKAPPHRIHSFFSFKGFMN